MVRNREIRWTLIVFGLISVLGMGIAYLYSPIASGIILLTSVLLTVNFMVFTRWRYREIEKLSDYLRQIVGGDYSLDVRDNQEGELSILKNDIYKVTLMLSEQRSLLLQDKIKLTDAISDISHQLKTPLTSMMVMADLLSNSELPPPKRAEFTHNITLQLERIDWLVTSLLKLSKMDAGTILFKKEPIAVDRLIHKALEPVLIPMDLKEQKLHIEGDKTVSFVGDLNWTAEALLNILKNGVEHTEHGGTITVAYSENALYTEIIVSDNGKGIPKEELPYLFRRFYKGKFASEGSIGIGLAMAHSIITSQNGDIEVKSEEGIGTEFRIKFYKMVI